MATLRKKIAGAAKVAGVYLDIAKVTGLSRNAGETFVQYVERVGEHLGNMPDESFSTLSQATQDWYDKAVDAVVDKKDPGLVPALEDWPEDGAAPAPEVKAATAQATTGAATAEPKGDTTVAAKKTLKKKPVAAKKTAATKPAKTKKTNGNGEARAARTDGVAYKIRLAVIKKHDISFEDAAEKAGIPKTKAVIGSHAHNMWNHARIVVGMQDELSK